MSLVHEAEQPGAPILHYLKGCGEAETSANIPLPMSLVHEAEQPDAPILHYSKGCGEAETSASIQQNSWWQINDAGHILQYYADFKGCFLLIRGITFQHKSVIGNYRDHICRQVMH